MTIDKDSIQLFPGGGLDGVFPLQVYEKLPPLPQSQLNEEIPSAPQALVANLCALLQKSQVVWQRTTLGIPWF
jgi:hypothetical protein